MPPAPTFGRRGLRTPVAASPSPSPSAIPSPPSAPVSRPARNSEGINLGWLLFSFDGRIPRLHYWLAQIGLFILFRIVVLASRSLSDAMKAAQASHTVGPGLLVTSLVALLLIFPLLIAGLWAGLAVVVKRWHDRGKSGLWASLGFVPLLGWAWQGIECGFLEGTLGPNRFGPSPKGISSVTYGDMLAETFS